MERIGTSSCMMKERMRLKLGCKASACGHWWSFFPSRAVKLPTAELGFPEMLAEEHTDSHSHSHTQIQKGKKKGGRSSNLKQSDVW